MPTPAQQYPPNLTQPELDTFFPIDRPPIAPGVFEIGLVLGGTVSAGAYTAGVLDYFFEALDAWTAAKEQNSAEAPPHDVVISTLGGTSGGAICAALVARASGWSFPSGPDPRNPFYAAWTSGVDLMKLLSTTPEPNVTGFASVLNCDAISRQAQQSVAWTGEPLGMEGSPQRRSYLADPLRLTMMVGNITGLPYSMSFVGETGLTHDMVAHQDYMQFALTVPGGCPNAYRTAPAAPAGTPPIQRTRPDEIALSTSSDISWSILGDAATATSAFPFAFRSRPLERSLAACGYRVVVAPGDDHSPAQVMQLIPKWPTLSASVIAGTVPFANVDGGVFNNQPLDMVRMALAGMNGRNDRAGTAADRTVILINPFSDPETLGPTTPPDLPNLALPFVMSMIYQSRFKPEDIALAQDPTIYSRFLIAPCGPGDGTTPPAGQSVIASGGLGGFLGFVDPSFLDYDYRLGRRNAYEFLSEQLVFPDDNPTFQDAAGHDRWTPEQIASQRPSDPSYATTHRRMIPLMKSLQDKPPPLPTVKDWPKIAGVPDAVGPAIAARLDTIYDQLTALIKPSSFLARAATSLGFGLAWRLWLRGTLRDTAVNAIQQGLKNQHLLLP